MNNSNYFFKTLLAILVVFLFFSPEISTCQQFSVVSTSPADGATNVATVITFEIIFNSPLDTTARFPIPGDLFLGLIVPEDNLMSEPDSITLSQDLKTVRFHNIQLWEDTQYFIGITAAKSQNGESLDLPSALNFTTGATLPTGSVSGTITFFGGDVRGTVVNLFTDLIGEGEAINGTVVNQSTGEYTINYVENGEYLVLALKDISKDGDLDPIEQLEPFGVYDSNSDKVPDLVTVSGGQAVVGINLEIQFPASQTAQHWYDDALTVAQNSFQDAQLAGAISENFQTDGTSSYWMYLFVSVDQQRSLFMMVLNGYFLVMDESDTSGFEGFYPVPDGWIDSDLAADSAMVNGGSDFLNNYPNAVSQAWLITMAQDGPPKQLNKVPFLSKQKLKKKSPLQGGTNHRYGGE